MGAVVSDVEEARTMHNTTAVREHVRKAAFPELRSAFLRYGGNLAAKFLELEKKSTTLRRSILRNQQTLAD